MSRVLAVDSQIDALELAKENGLSNNVDNVEFQVSNWFDNILHSRYDLIVANPPYVAVSDPHLTQGDLRFEPNTALVSGKDGLDGLRSIILAAPQYLNTHAFLLLEHGFEQHEQVAELMRKAGYCSLEMARDLNGLPRCTIGQWSHESK